MIRVIAKLFVFTLALTPFVYIEPLFAAAPLTFLSSSGSGTECIGSQPCGQFSLAIAGVDSGGEILCLDSLGELAAPISTPVSVTFDCPGVWAVNFTSDPALALVGANQVMKIRNLTFNGVNSDSSAIKVTGSGTLILENCVFESFSGGTALDIEPTGPLNLVIKNSRISNNGAAGVLLKPASGGSVTATFDGVTITNNAGGLRTDTTNGAVRLDISNSTISNNANNGLIAIGGAGGQNMVNLSRDVLASNGQVGIEASGTNAAALVDTTLLDSNTGGALSAVSGGRILTYQNNRIVGSPGTGFTGTASPQ
jgi:hypothetical protein